jgi:hypothetical protein
VARRRDSGSWPSLRGFAITYIGHTTLSRTPWKSDQPDTEISTWQHTAFTGEKHSCPRRDSNLQSEKAKLHRTHALDRSVTKFGRLKLDDLIYIVTGGENLSVIKTVMIKLIIIVLIHDFVCFTIYSTLRFLWSSTLHSTIKTKLPTFEEIRCRNLLNIPPDHFPQICIENV